MNKNANTNIIAAFDFDNTITNCDSLLPFLCFTKGTFKTYSSYAALLPRFLGYPFHLLTRQQAKELILRKLLGGMPLDIAKAQANHFAMQQLDQYVKPEAIQRLRWHQEQGHRCVLISAAIELYLEAWANKYAFDHLICSKCEISKERTLTGNLLGANCWGPEKVRRLMQTLALNKNDFTLYVYGDSRGDKELLEMADFAFYRNFTTPTRKSE